MRKGLSVYSRTFDERSANWQKDPKVNQLFLICQQNYMNYLLNVRGHVFLNEVYDALGLQRSAVGQLVGWVLDSEEGDSYIDIVRKETEDSIVLDFNVDGIIYEDI